METGAELGSNDAHFTRVSVMVKAKFHYEAAAMAGNESARFNIGTTEYNLGNVEQAVKHWMIAASAGHYIAMHNLLITFKQGLVSRDSIDSTLKTTVKQFYVRA